MTQRTWLNLDELIRRRETEQSARRRLGARRKLRNVPKPIKVPMGEGEDNEPFAPDMRWGR